MSVVLTCSCGLKMKAPGATPGRVGKCPRCGSFLKVPDETPEASISSPVTSPTPPVATTSATFVRRRSRVQGGLPSRARSDGFVAAPKIAEARFLDSLSYPLWNASGIGLLAFMPPLLWFCTSPLFAISSMLERGGIRLIGVIFMVPMLFLILAVGGYILLFLGQVLVTSSLGEVAQPRAPGWDLSEIGDGLARWSWAFLIGVVVGGLPAVAYWIGCGEVDLFDRIVLVDLLLPGMAYAQMALAATLIHESPLAANPVTVTRAIRRVGWAYLIPCIESATMVVIVAGLFAGVLRIKGGLAQSVACYLFWVVTFYMAMVFLRRLGLFYYRNAVVLD